MLKPPLLSLVSFAGLLVHRQGVPLVNASETGQPDSGGDTASSSSRVLTHLSSEYIESDDDNDDDDKTMSTPSWSSMTQPPKPTRPSSLTILVAHHPGAVVTLSPNMARQSTVTAIQAPHPEFTSMRVQGQEERLRYRTVVTFTDVASEEESERDDNTPLKDSKCNKQIRKDGLKVPLKPH